MPSIPPWARLIALVIAMVGTLIANRLAPLAIALAVVIMLLTRAGLLRVFVKFVCAILAPTLVMLMLAWVVIIRAAPGESIGSDPRGGALYAIMIALRLAVLAGVIQLALLSVPPRLLPVTLRKWGIKKEAMVVAMGILAVGPELALRAEQVSTARKARGLRQSGIWRQLRELTRVLRPLFVWSIRSAVHRSEAWHQRALLLKVDRMPSDTIEFSPAGGIAAVALSVVWFGLSIYLRIA